MRYCVLLFLTDFCQRRMIWRIIEDRIIAKALLPADLRCDLSANDPGKHMFATIFGHITDGTDELCAPLLILHLIDYVKELTYTVYPNWETFVAQHGTKRCYFMTRYGKRPPSSFDFRAETGDIYLVFGKESTGIPLSILRTHLDRCMRLPMVASARSLNLSNTVAIGVYEVLRQLDYPGLSRQEVIKGEDWIIHD